MDRGRYRVNPDSRNSSETRGVLYPDEKRPRNSTPGENLGEFRRCIFDNFKSLCVKAETRRTFIRGRWGSRVIRVYGAALHGSRGAPQFLHRVFKAPRYDQRVDRVIRSGCSRR